MAIHFSAERWQRVKDTHRSWWRGDVGRPLIQAAVGGRDPKRAEPALPRRHFHAHYDPDVSPEEVIDRVDFELSSRRWFADGFPSMWPNFGPGVIAAFTGCTLESDERTCWFHPQEDIPCGQMPLEFHPESYWFQRIADLSRAGLERWEGLVQIGMTDLGGNLDILSSFRPGEKLLLDLYDCPEDVKRVTWKAHEIWWRYYEAFNEILQPVNPGYTAWTPIYSESPYYILQCDFCYMIGPDMFDEFVKPELAASCRRLGNAFYHLDGPGQLPHLDSLLSIPELKGVQWVPGDGNPDVAYWPEVYRKIHEAGKLIQVWPTAEYGFGILDVLAEQIGTAEGIVVIGEVGTEDESHIRDICRKYDAPWDS